MIYNLSDIINNYYLQNLKTNLHLLHIFSRQEIIYILDFFINKDLNLSIFLNKIELLIKKISCNISKLKIINKINLITSNLLFIDIDKDNYILPTLILEDDVSEEMLKKFFEIILYDCIMQTFINFKETIKQYNIYSHPEINSLSMYKDIYYISQNLKINIINYYYNIFVSFYTNILNKHDTEVDYIFPMILDSNLLLSGIVNDKKILKKNNMLNDIGGNNKIDKIQNKLEELSKEPYIKNLYTKSEIENLEQILNSSKLNNLIKRKKIFLSKDFKNIIEEISNDKIKKINENKKLDDENFFNDNQEIEKNDEENFKKYIDKIFLINDNDENIDTNILSNIISKHPNREKFLEYFIDKIIYNQHLNSNESNQNNNNTYELVSVIDNVFEQILNHDYDHNTLNLENDDIKFILMLETLDAIKNQNTYKNSNKNNSNVTLNIYKNVNKAKINDEEITLSY